MTTTRSQLSILDKPSVRTLSYAARGLLGSVLALLENSATPGVLCAPTGMALAEFLAKATCGSPDEVAMLLEDICEVGAIVLEQSSLSCPEMMANETRRRQARERKARQRSKRDVTRERKRKKKRRRKVPTITPLKKKRKRKRKKFSPPGRRKARKTTAKVTHNRTESLRSLPIGQQWLPSHLANVGPL